MHLLPSSFNGSLFLGTTLEYVCFFPYSVMLYFSYDNSKFIKVESRYILRSENEVLEHVTEFPIQSSKLLCCIGKKILKFDINRKENSILLHFESNMSVEILDTPNYEAYRIWDDEQDIIV